MLTANRDLMHQAREALKGKWGLALLANLIFLVAFIGIRTIPIIGDLALLALGGPFLLGLTLFFLSLSRNEAVPLSRIFDGFQRFKDALLLFLLLSIAFGVWSFLAFLPLIVALFVLAGYQAMLGGYQHVLTDYLALSSYLIAIFVFWALLNIILQIIVSYSLALSFFILGDRPELKVVGSLKMSIKWMGGRRWKLSCLFMRFTGWFLLGILTIGIGYLWILPYLWTSMARFYDDLREAEGSAADPGTQAKSPAIPIPRPSPPRPSQPARPVAPSSSAPAEPPKPAPHVRARTCLSCHAPIPDPESKFCPTCGFPLIEVPAPPRALSAADQTPKPANSLPSARPVPPPVLKENPPPPSAPLPRPLDLEGTIMVGPPRLISMSPEGQKEFYDLRLPVIKIGRAGDNHLSFPQERAISGHHCEIFREGKNFFIRDLGSTNGVFVNSRQVESAPLTEGDEIKLGGKVFSFTRSG